MDLPFLSEVTALNPTCVSGFNPYSNGSSFFILKEKFQKEDMQGFNPYSNGSSFFIIVPHCIFDVLIAVSILILMDLPFLLQCLRHLLLYTRCVSILILMDLPFL